jgi:cytochrome c oxidase subunit 2
VRRGSIAQLLLLSLVFAAAATAVALLIPWLPPVASKERHRIDIVFWVATAICIGIFSIVASAIVFAVLRFRRAPDDDSDGPPIHGHTGLEIAWTAIPAVLVTAIAIVSSIVLVRNGRAGPNPLRVTVTAQQFVWSFKYTNHEAQGVVSPVLYLPRGQSVKLTLLSVDVIHSFWVPEFGQKQDAVPGTTQHLVITPTKDGTYPVICTELCGLGHATMRSQAVVMEPSAFAAWAKKQKPSAAAGGGPAAGGGTAASGKSAFMSNGCNSCHTLAAASATGKVGPDLDRLKAEAQRAGKPLDAFVRESIVDPNAYIEPGFPKGVMPTSFGTSIPKPQLDALVQFLVQSAKGAK